MKSLTARQARRAAALSGTVIAAVALSACGSTRAGGAESGTVASPSTTVSTGVPSTATAAPPPTTATTTAQTTTTAAPPTAPATTSPAETAGCTGSQLRTTEKTDPSGNYLNYGLGHSSAVLLFTNISNRPCSLHGYPGAAGLNSSGVQVTQAQRSPGGYMGGLAVGDHTLPDVILAPRQSASAVIEGTDNPQGEEASCPTLAGLLVTAPNTRTSVHLPKAPADCSGLQIHPVVSGTTGDQHH